MSNVGGALPRVPYGFYKSDVIEEPGGTHEQVTKAPEDPAPAQSAQPSAKPSPFASLAPYGEHVLYYRQRDNPASRLTEGDFTRAKLRLTETQREDAIEKGEGGVCQGLALSWAAERLRTTNSSGLRQKLSFQQKHFNVEPNASALAADPANMSDEKKAEKRALTARGASAQLLGPPKTSSNKKSETTLEARQQASLGIKPFHEDTGDGGILTPRVKLIPSDPDDATQKPFSTVMAEAGQRLEKGQAMTASMTVKNNDGRFIDRHAMAMYKSRAGNLRFFDPDGGEFQVRDPQNFFSAYENLKKSDRGWNFQFVTAARIPDKLSFYKRCPNGTIDGTKVTKETFAEYVLAARAATVFFRKTIGDDIQFADMDFVCRTRQLQRGSVRHSVQTITEVRKPDRLAHGVIRSKSWAFDFASVNSSFCR